MREAVNASDDPVVRGNALAARGDLAGAASCYRLAIALRPALPAGHLNLGNVLAQAGQLQGAVDCYRRALALRPDLAAAHGNLGNALRGMGQLGEAAAALARAVALQPGDAVTRYNLAVVWRQLGAVAAARDAFAAAVRLRPDFAAALAGLGGALLALGQSAAAIEALARAVALAPDCAAFHNDLGNALREAGRVEAAIDCHTRAVALQPDFAVAHENLGNELQELGRFDAARTAYARAVLAAPRCASHYLALANAGGLTVDAPEFAGLQALAGEIENLAPGARAEVHFALATVLDAAGTCDAAFSHWVDGNRAQRGLIAYDEDAALARLTRIARAYHAGVFAGRGDVAADGPVFVVGMPRSGTTLVEQILASHPAVFGAGELASLPRLVDRLGLGDGVPAAAALAALGSDYTAAVHRRAPEAARIVDKLPDNALRAGLIHLAMPGARIIHVRRDGFETCMSCFTKLFRGDVPYAYDLAELGRYYRAHAGLMAHWQRVLPDGVWLEVAYAALIADLPGQTARMLAHCGLEWDAACLDFGKTARPVRTASTMQVRAGFRAARGWARYRRHAAALTGARAGGPP